MDALRRHMSKSFFNSIMVVSNGKKSSQRAIRFKVSIENGEIMDSITIPNYIRNLYDQANPIQLIDFGVGYDNSKVFEEHELIKAGKKLSMEKACGLDGLQDYWLKDRAIFSAVLDKLKSTFNSWY